MRTMTTTPTSFREVQQAREKLEGKILRLQVERDRLARLEKQLAAQERARGRLIEHEPPENVVVIRNQSEWDLAQRMPYVRFTELRVEGNLDRISATPSNTVTRIISGAQVRSIDDNGNEKIDGVYVERGAHVDVVSGTSKITFVRGQVGTVQGQAYVRVVGLTGRVDVLTSEALVGDLYGTVERLDGKAVVRAQQHSGVVGRLNEMGEIRHAAGRTRVLSGGRIKNLENTGIVLHRTGGTIEKAEAGSVVPETEPIRRLIGMLSQKPATAPSPVDAIEIAAPQDSENLEVSSTMQHCCA